MTATISGRLVDWQRAYLSHERPTRLERGSLRWPSLIAVKPVVLLIRNGEIRRPIGRVTNIKETLSGLEIAASLRADDHGEYARNEIRQGFLPFLTPILAEREGRTGADGVQQIRRARLIAVSLMTIDLSAGVIEKYNGFQVTPALPSVVA